MNDFPTLLAVRWRSRTPSGRPREDGLPLVGMSLAASTLPLHPPTLAVGSRPRWPDGRWQGAAVGRPGGGRGRHDHGTVRSVSWPGAGDAAQWTSCIWPTWPVRRRTASGASTIRPRSSWNSGRRSRRPTSDADTVTMSVRHCNNTAATPFRHHYAIWRAGRQPLRLWNPGFLPTLYRLDVLVSGPGQRVVSGVSGPA